MKFLLDTSSATMQRRSSSPLVGGQLLTPLTRYASWAGDFGIDNGAFSGFDAESFCTLLNRERTNIDRCLFVTCPDIVGSARRTLELFAERSKWISEEWPLALVAQNGLENLDVPWRDIRCLFIGGVDPWKDSAAAADLVRTAKILGKHVHVGRVNGPKRFKHFDRLGADTCDGSGVAMYDWMLEKIERSQIPEKSLFDAQELS